MSCYNDRSADGFIVLKGDNASVTIGWADVEHIFTCKIDCDGYDKISLAFENWQEENDRGHDK